MCEVAFCNIYVNITYNKFVQRNITINIIGVKEQEKYASSHSMFRGSLTYQIYVCRYYLETLL